MSHQSRAGRERAKPTDAKNSAKSNFFLPKEVNANTASPHPAESEDDNVSVVILSKLKSFRREDNEKMTTMTSAITSLEHSVEKIGERLTHAEDRINQVEEGSARLLGYLLQLEERPEKSWNISQGGTICECMWS